MIFSFLFSGALWFYLELAFFVIGLAIFGCQFYFRVLTVRKAIVWFLALYCAPILTVAAWTFIGRPFFRRRIPTHRGEDTASVDAAIAADPDNTDLRIARSLSVGGALKYSADSSAHYIGTGSEFFDSVNADIENATESIYIECYIIRRDEMSRNFVDLLCRKASEGVRVMIMFDDYGYDGGTKGYIRKLNKAGVETAVFHNMSRYILSPVKNVRNHRKTFVIDGKVAYQGGYNVGDEYLGKGKFGEWRDAAVKVTGPQVVQFMRMFADDWEYAAKHSAEITYPENIEPAGTMGMQVIPGDPVYPDENAVGAQMLQMVRNAKKRIWIVTPYFAPVEAVFRTLCDAAASGVDVRVIIPDIGDHPHVFWGNRKYASVAMKNGARVFEYHKGFIHTKTILVDDRYCSIGSANFDIRSVKLNYECNVMVYSEELAQDLEREFLKDLESCTEYTLEAYRSRGAGAKIKTILATVFREQL